MYKVCITDGELVFIARAYPCVVDEGKGIKAVGCSSTSSVVPNGVLSFSHACIIYVHG